MDWSLFSYVHYDCLLLYIYCKYCENYIKRLLSIQIDRLLCLFVFLKYTFYMTFVLIMFKLKAEEYAGFLSNS